MYSVVKVINRIQSRQYNYRPTKGNNREPTVAQLISTLPIPSFMDTGPGASPLDALPRLQAPVPEGARGPSRR